MIPKRFLEKFRNAAGGGGGGWAAWIVIKHLDANLFSQTLLSFICL